MTRMTNIKTPVQLFICSIFAVLLAACGGQAESDALISANQNQFYARNTQLASAQEAALASETAAQPDVPTASNVPAIEPIPAMEIPADPSSTGFPSSGAPSQ